MWVLGHVTGWIKCPLWVLPCDLSFWLPHRASQSPFIWNWWTFELLDVPLWVLFKDHGMGGLVQTQLPSQSTETPQYCFPVVCLFYGEGCWFISLGYTNLIFRNIRTKTIDKGLTRWIKDPSKVLSSVPSIYIRWSQLPVTSNPRDQKPFSGPTVIQIHLHKHT